MAEAVTQRRAGAAHPAPAIGIHATTTDRTTSIGNDHAVPGRVLLDVGGVARCWLVPPRIVG
jgi:hypothetical protein